MAGLLAWAADVVGGGQLAGEGASDSAVVFTPEQRKYALELELKVSSLNRSIQDLRPRIPPAHISQRLPHLHAHSLASNAALALQHNAHSATREQAQLREVALQEENAVYEKAISNYEKKMGEKFQEVDLLREKLQEADLTQKQLKAELEQMQPFPEPEHSFRLVDSRTNDESPANTETLGVVDLVEGLESKKKELISVEEMVRTLQNKWAQVQQDSFKKPSPAQRERNLDKQLQSSIEQLSTKQAQEEGLIGEIHVKELELDRLNGLRKTLENGSMDAATARNRFGRTGSGLDSTHADYIIEPQNRNLPIGSKMGHQHKLMLLRSIFVLYIFVLQLLVFIKISF